ncbi:3-oxoacyl-ACP synthase III family protein [Kitasatospora sp. NPDC088391]|uniref:3-oxoacyl-ACP synthase III family protein n=1 Tax=Kitasatospora sp. NPDC088391 TaxID=3364074 RepID=UPI003817587F
MGAVNAVGVWGTGRYVPERVRPNAEVAGTVGVTPEWIAERTGVRQRHVAADGQAASDLAAAAVRRALDSAGVTADRIGLLVCATSTPDELGPATACRVQALVGAAGAVALDVSAACSGWLFGTKVAHDWLRGADGPMLAVVVGVEAYSKFVDPADRATAVLFADGAAATVLGPVEPPGGLGGFRLGSDGTLADRVLIPAGGSRLPADGKTLAAGEHRIRMDGRFVSRFIREAFPRMLHETLRAHGLTVADLDHVITHQPNPVLLHRLAEESGLADRMTVVGDLVGNIGAASAPYALATAHAEGRLRPGDLILLTVFGAGMTWGSALLRWSGDHHPLGKERPS